MLLCLQVVPVVVVVRFFKMVFEIFNSAFIVGSPDLNKISVVEGGAPRSVIISFAACFKNLPTLLLEKGIHGV